MVPDDIEFDATAIIGRGRPTIFKPNVLPFQLLLVFGVASLLWLFCRFPDTCLHSGLSLFAILLLVIAPGFGTWVRHDSRIEIDEEGIVFRLRGKDTRIQFRDIVKLDLELFQGQRISGQMWKIYSSNSEKPYAFALQDDYSPQEMDTVLNSILNNAPPGLTVRRHQVTDHLDGRRTDEELLDPRDPSAFKL